MSEIFHESYLEFKDPKKEALDLRIGDCLNLIRLFKQNEVDYRIIGGLSLAILAKAYYRVPSNIDILISKKDSKKVTDLIEEFGYTRISYVKELDNFYSYSSNLFKKYAACNILNCTTNEESADLFYIDNQNFYVHKTKNSLSNDNFSINEFVPLWIYHDPSDYTKEIDPITEDSMVNSRKQIEIFDNKFTVNFSTSYYMIRDPHEYKFFIKFYSKNMEHIETQECSFLGESRTPARSFFSNMRSGVFPMERYNNLYYRVFSERPYCGVSYINPSSQINLSIYVNETQFKYKIECTLNEQKVLVSCPQKIMEYKLKKFTKKDFDDYDFYGTYLNSYFNK
jgi:hypothetical protein